MDVVTTLHATHYPYTVIARSPLFRARTIFPLGISVEKTKIARHGYMSHGAQLRC